ncbi:MAG TPA: penicillin-binding protein 1A [Dongiaceae bacterium]|nr:penicillin-binding protein 1A [Dongiaceae bacterium]
MRKILLYVLGLFLTLGLVGAAGVYLLLARYAADLPDYKQLATYDPPVVTRVHAGDGRLLAEYAIEKRAFVPIAAIPKRVVNAFLSAEDKTFYSHPGIDLPGIVKAVVVNLANLGSERRPVGASTITQQVAKNFLLGGEVSLRRKVREAILALRIEQAFSKDRILELYLNEIYLGYGSYGVAAAALNYFNKSLDELTVAEAAYLAALPKAPNNYHPLRRAAAAKARRDWVIDRLLDDGSIDPAEAAAAVAEPLVVRPSDPLQTVSADYFAEELRRELIGRFGEAGLYRGGLSVRATLDPRLQAIADRTLRDGLAAYDRRHGWRGPLARIEPDADWAQRLAAVPPPAGLRDWNLAAVLEVASDGARVGLLGGAEGRVPPAEMSWLRSRLADLRPGDVVAVEPVGEDAEGRPYPADSYALRQIPEVGGALVALDPHTGRVLAMSGGWSYAMSEFNRATQALRQPGSAFKPLVYLAALESGLTPSTIILDAPIVIDQGPGLPKWKPENYTDEFYGPSTMRLGIEKSRNLMTVRLAQTIGMDRVVAIAQRLGVVDRMQPTLSMALGAGETTLLRLTTAYAMIVNGGRRIRPTLIDRVQDRNGATVFRHDTRPCEGCRADDWHGQAVPRIPDQREQVVNARVAYQMVSMLQGVVERGTGVRIREVGKPLAGKTGTTNDSNDTWFIGFSPDLAVGVYVGFDAPRSLGEKETGASVAVPVFRDFMAAALADRPAIPFRVPPGIRLVRVNALTGQRAQPGDDKVILEAFAAGSEPTGKSVVIEGYGTQAAGGAGPAEPPTPAGIGGLY